MHVFREVPLTAGSNYSTVRVLRQPTVTSAVISALICGSSVTPAINTHTFILKDIIFNQIQRASREWLHSSLTSPLHWRPLSSRSHTRRHTCKQALPCVGIFFSPFFFFFMFLLCVWLFIRTRRHALVNSKLQATRRETDKHNNWKRRHQRAALPVAFRTVLASCDRAEEQQGRAKPRRSVDR